MLVGFNQPTSGDASVYGHSITENISQVQQIMGVSYYIKIVTELSGLPTI